MAQNVFDTVSSGGEPGITREIAQQKLVIWTNTQKFLFRIVFIFFISICIPNSLEWYKHLVNIDWANLHYRDLYDVARFGSGLNFFGTTLFGSALSGYANWIFTFLISVLAALVWTLIDNRRETPERNYN